MPMIHVDNKRANDDGFRGKMTQSSQTILSSFSRMKIIYKNQS